MKDNSIIGGISQKQSFAALCQNDRAHQHLFTRHTYSAGECVHGEGSPITHLGVVESGILKALSYSVSGLEFCTAYFEKDDLFPEFLYFTGKRQYTYSLFVERRATILWIPTSTLDEMLEENPAMAGAMMLYLSQRGLKNQLYLNCIVRRTIRERIAYWIVGIQSMQTETERDTLPLPHSQMIFANLLHVSRSSLNQELKAMEKEGFFRLGKHIMYNINAEKLSELL